MRASCLLSVSADLSSIYSPQSCHMMSARQTHLSRLWILAAATRCQKLRSRLTQRNNRNTHLAVYSKVIAETWIRPCPMRRHKQVQRRWIDNPSRSVYGQQLYVYRLFVRRPPPRSSLRLRRADFHQLFRRRYFRSIRYLQTARAVLGNSILSARCRETTVRACLHFQLRCSSIETHWAV